MNAWKGRKTGVCVCVYRHRCVWEKTADGYKWTEKEKKRKFSYRKHSKTWM